MGSSIQKSGPSFNIEICLNISPGVALETLGHTNTMGLIAETKQAIKDSPKGIFNWYVLMCTCIFAFSGVSKGFDEGRLKS